MKFFTPAQHLTFSSPNIRPLGGPRGGFCFALYNWPWASAKLGFIKLVIKGISNMPIHYVVDIVKGTDLHIESSPEVDQRRGWMVRVEFWIKKVSLWGCIQPTFNCFILHSPRIHGEASPALLVSIRDGLWLQVKELG
ncbi:hypothetical protein PGT21_018238 [Puccinia graminis f. sp. tritici]|uniref:Uncharacterized protein n=1 Tax=Puccinia graminis f. sp. tritici TaxID=56615 RepID=A0A5B0QAT0_PUCGR|nr:hypothetical protein PGT21_018238 [Puccinia graminis f. sp. tritici]